MNGTGGYLVTIYVLYGAVSVGLTVWLARTLFRNGGVFLEDVFEDRPHLAAAVNRLLVTGFYMGNLGYAFLLLRANVAGNAVTAVEVLIHKLGILLVSLALIHFFNLYLFYRIRQRAMRAHEPAPVAPQTTVGPPAPPLWDPQWQQP